LFDVSSWGRKVGANSWRISADIADNWASMSHNGFDVHSDATAAGPGAWNDPDMLEVGNGGLSEEEYRTHLTLWSIQAAPLILGNDVRSMSPDTLRLLLNREVIAIDQDTSGVQGKRIIIRPGIEVWARPLRDQETAVAIFNRGAVAAELSVEWADLGLSGARQIRDLWRHMDLGILSANFRVHVPAHGAMLLKVGHATQ
jgi:alpha-galactosidase